MICHFDLPEFRDGLQRFVALTCQDNFGVSCYDLSLCVVKCFWYILFRYVAKMFSALLTRALVMSRGDITFCVARSCRHELRVFGTERFQSYIIGVRSCLTLFLEFRSVKRPNVSISSDRYRRRAGVTYE